MALIAVIDDDHDILDASSLVLTAKGYDVITADNPDDGFFLAQKFRKEKFEIPIIMYTSVSKALGLEFAAGEMIPVDDFVEKPISPDTLIDKVEKLLQLHYKE